MTGEQWDRLLAVITGEVVEPLPVGFIIDSPWLPGWAGISTLDYYSSERLWLEANFKAVRRFPEVMFLPGFWSEYGMCTEPSAFGSKCSWREQELPYSEKIPVDFSSSGGIDRPDPRGDGLLPFVLRRLKHCRGEIEDSGHLIKFAVSRGPLNIASFLMGPTEFLMGIRTEPEATERLLGAVTDFIVEWLQLQAEAFESIDGVLILDDIVGFLGDEDFRTAALPYLKRTFGAVDARVRFFHNDAAGLVCARYLEEIGVNMFNFSFEHGLAEMQELTGNAVTLVGNIPPRDVLAGGSPEEVEASVHGVLESVGDRRRLILSCGGGMPGGVPSENIEAFVSAAGRV